MFDPICYDMHHPNSIGAFIDLNPSRYIIKPTSDENITASLGNGNQHIYIYILLFINICHDYHLTTFDISFVNGNERHVKGSRGKGLKAAKGICQSGVCIGIPA